jgi:hypothetical protein
MSVLGQSIRTSLAATLCAGFLSFAAAPALAAPIGFMVTVNTSSLSGNPAAPFYLDFQLTNGAAVSNSATISNFSFGGGSASGAATLDGGASGSLASSVFLTDTSFINEFYQAFTPGSLLSFFVTLSRNVDSSLQPDGFSVAILDNNLFNIPTTGFGDQLVSVDINSANFGAGGINTFRGTGEFSNVAATAQVPVPGSAPLFMLGIGLLGALRARQRSAVAA